MIVEEIKMSKGYHYSDEEVEFIKANWETKTDKQIAKVLGRSEESVQRQRKKYGMSKGSGRPSNEDIEKAKMERASKKPDSYNLASLDKNQRLEIYKQNFNKNPRYSTLIGELHGDEFEYYKHKYVEFMDSVDTITIQEEDSLHHMIMADISISRIRRNIKLMEEEKEEEDRPLIFGLYDTLDKAERKFMEYQKILRVTRESRLKENKEEKETFVTMVNMYRNRVAREEMGRQAGIINAYKEICKDEMKASRYLLGD